MSAFDAQRHEQSLRDRIAFLLDEKLKALRDLEQALEVLRWYADEHCYHGHDPEALHDCGERARQAIRNSESD